MFVRSLKSRKIDSLIVQTVYPPSVRTHHNFRKTLIFFATKDKSSDVRCWKKALATLGKSSSWLRNS